MSQFTLTSAERNSPLWAKLKAHLESERDTLRRKNDGDLGEMTTAKIRGRIAELNELLALDKPGEQAP